MTGRELPPTSAFAGDDGSADPGVAAALAARGAGSGTVAAVVAALAGTRVLVPVLAELDSAGVVEVGGHTHTVEKEASAGIVALQAPDGRTALPVFSSVATMSAWRADARPVPTEIARAALSAVEEGWELLVLDPGGPATVLLPRPAVWALAQQQAWEPAVVAGAEGSEVAPDVRRAVRDAVRGAFGGVPGSETRGEVPDEARSEVRSEVRRAARGGDPRETRAAVPGEVTSAAPAPAPRRWWRRAPAGTPVQDTPVAGPTAPVAGPVAGPTGPVVEVDATPGTRAEVAVELTLVPGLDRAALDAVLARVGAALAADETVAQRVDSVEVRLR